MNCPNANDWGLLTMEVLEDEQAERMVEHARTCQTCREQFQTARRAHVDRVRMYEAFDRDHDELREQLMAALPDELPKRSGAIRLVRGWARLGDIVMSLNKTAGRRAAAKGRLRWYGLGALLTIATPIVVWGMFQALEKVSYRTGRHETVRGEVIPLPNGRFWVTHAYYSDGGARMLVYACGGTDAAGGQDNSGGYWLLDPASGKGQLIHDNFDGSLFWGASLSQVNAASPSPDGRYIAAFRKSYSDAARSIASDDPQQWEQWELLESALDSYQWELIEVATAGRTLLMDLTEEYQRRDFVRKPRGFV